VKAARLYLVKVVMIHQSTMSQCRLKEQPSRTVSTLYRGTALHSYSPGGASWRSALSECVLAGSALAHND